MTSLQAYSAEREPDYGPSLPELLRPRLKRLPGWQRAAVGLAVLGLVGAVAALVVRHEVTHKAYHQSQAEARARDLEPIRFHFDYSSRMKLSKPPGDYVRVERRPKGTLVGRLTVSPMRMPRERESLSGLLPILADRLERRAERHFNGSRLQFEGRSRVSDVEGYQFALNAHLPRPGRPARQLFVRVVMLPEPFDPGDPGKPYPPGQGPTHGVLITMEATSLEGVEAPHRVGDEGSLRLPFRSFEFGG